MTEVKAWLDLVAPLAVILSAVAGIAAAIFISLQVAHMKRAREVDTFLRILDTGNCEPVCSAANWVKYSMPPELSYEHARADQATWQRISAVEHHFEMLGILVERNYISADLIFDQMGPWIAGSWSKLRSVIGAHRAARNAPDYAENFELLARRYEEWASQHPAKLEDRARASKQAIQDYYRQTLPNNAFQRTQRWATFSVAHASTSASVGPLNLAVRALESVKSHKNYTRCFWSNGETKVRLLERRRYVVRIS